MEYVLVSDDCNDCSYVSNLLSMLKLSFKKLLIRDTSADIITKTLHTSHSTAIFVCKNLTEQNTSIMNFLLNSVSKKIISWCPKDSLSQPVNNAIHFLKMPFGKYELKNTLADCDDVEKNETILSSPVFNRLIGTSKKMLEIKSMIAQVARSDTTVLILGQSGTGKDIIASCIHQLSDFKSNLFVPINCGAIPSELMESELFGHEKGAFTGALTKRAGRFEVANNGTLFLDEIGDMPLSMQVKLLRVIQDRKIERIGGNQSLDINVRLIAATHKNLENMISENKFRQDLYYRLNVFPINVPSLNERKEDIPLIIDYQLDRIYDRLKHRIAFTDNAMELLCEYPWPGNIRELQNYLERMVILYPDHVLGENKINLNVKSNICKLESNKSKNVSENF